MPFLSFVGRHQLCVRGVVIADPEAPDRFAVCLEDGRYVGGYVFEEDADAELARLTS
jgi:hypothetical protein